MSHAPNYTPTVSFATEETNSVAGRSTVRTTAIDTELANLSSSVNGLNTNIKLLQRDDGKLKDGLIEPYALSEQARALIASGGTPRGAWVSGQQYNVGDAVQYGATVYLCHTAHLSTVSFASGLFMALSGDGSSFVSAAESAASALESQGYADTASAAAISASSSASTASTHATNASGHATAAQNSATAAALSAASAASVISSSTAGASKAEAEAFTDNSKYMSSLRVSQSFEKKLTNATSITAATDDKVLVKDTSAGDALKTVTTQSIADLPIISPTKTIGYGTGAGGAVTQTTSKAADVTLNKPCGQITTHGAALAAGASVLFMVNNNLFTSSDVVVLTGTSFSGNYRIETANSTSGIFGIRITNVTGGSLSQAIDINFAIIKCVIS